MPDRAQRFTHVVILLAGLFSGCVSGCASTRYVMLPPGGAERLDALLDGVVTPQPENSTLALTEEMKAALDGRIDRDWSSARKFNELRGYLFGDGELGISYQADHTRTAAETFASRTGNCLSLSMLFVAAARHVGLDSRFQTVSVRPTWDRQGSTMIRYEHIIAVGKLNPREDYAVDFLPELSGDGSEAEIIDDLSALSHYYNNLGAESVVDGDYDHAVAHILRSAKLKPGFSDAWNNLGAAFRRSGDHELAELSYKRALDLNRNNYSALGNLMQLYLASGRQDEAESFARRVNRYNQRNPYFHFYLAQLHYQNGELDESKNYIENAIHLKKDDPGFYEALADVNNRLGHHEAAQQAEAMAEQVRDARKHQGRSRATRVKWTQTVQLK